MKMVATDVFGVLLKAKGINFARFLFLLLDERRDVYTNPSG